MDWHQRFTQQARWTAQLRSYLTKKAGIHPHHRVLEVGCGSGAVLSDFKAHPFHFGLDINFENLHLARPRIATAQLTCGDAHHLPYPDGSMDFTICHFLLMWVNGEEAVKEMRRVTRRGGAVIAMAEPDYGGRIDFPPSLAAIGTYQTQSLRDQGADPYTGRKLRSWFRSAGLVEIETGVIGAQWQNKNIDLAEISLEWEVIRSDLQNYLPPEELQALETADVHSWQEGTRILFVPTFYAIGFVPRK
ncbi:MAG: class I SAM-dependent methyltransferase [Chloroflexota bacterium]